MYVARWRPSYHDFYAWLDSYNDFASRNIANVCIEFSPVDQICCTKMGSYYQSSTLYLSDKFRVYFLAKGFVVVAVVDILVAVGAASPLTIFVLFLYVSDIRSPSFAMAFIVSSWFYFHYLIFIIEWKDQIKK